MIQKTPAEKYREGLEHIIDAAMVEYTVSVITVHAIGKEQIINNTVDRILKLNMENKQPNT